MEIDSVIKKRESLAGRGAWHELVPFVTLKNAWAQRFAFFPVYLVAFNQDRIGHEREPNTITLLRVQQLAQDPAPAANGLQLRRDLLKEPSPLDQVFNADTGRFKV